MIGLEKAKRESATGKVILKEALSDTKILFIPSFSIDFSFDSSGNKTAERAIANEGMIPAVGEAIP